MPAIRQQSNALVFSIEMVAHSFIEGAHEHEAFVFRIEVVVVSLVFH